jgi:hypothetical protein
MEKCRWAIGTVLALVLLCSASSSPAADDKPPSDQKAGSEAVFDMKEVSLYEQKESENISPYAIFNGLNAMQARQGGQSLSQAELQAAALRLDCLQ